MHINRGILREMEFVNALNGKKVKDLTNNLKYILREMFGILDEEEIIACELVEKFQKPDFYIEYKGIRKYVSLKSGSAKAVAQIDIKSFIFYLREHGISKRSQQTILLFHFGDGTCNGTGKKRYNFLQISMMLKDRIIELNKELNSNPEFVVNFVMKHLFKGNNDSNIEADYIYHGTVEYGILCSKIQIYKYLKIKAEQNNWKFMINPHIGPLQFRPHARYVDGVRENEERRWKVTIWWANLPADLLYITERYNG